MTWLNPVAFAFLGLIPVIIVLHTLRYRRRDVQVSTLFLWDRVLREAHGTLGLRRLVQNLPLLLQILFVLLMTASLAQPALLKVVPERKDIVVVLDVSASMQTRTPQGTRFELAQQQALDILRTLPSDRRMAVIAAGRQPRVLTFFSRERALIRRAILDARVSDAPGNMRDAVLLALSFAQGERAQEVVVIGDGAYGPLTDLNFPREQLRHIRIAGGERNVGITRLALRKLPGQDDRYEVLIAVKNVSRQPLETPLQLLLHRRVLLERHLTLRAGQEEVVLTTLQGPLKGVAHAELLAEDDFPLDNHAYGVLAEQTQRWVLLVGESNYFLERLLTALPGVQVNVVPEVSAESLPQLREANHLLIFNGVQPPPLREGNFFLINTVPPDERFQAGGVISKPQILDWQSRHPLLQYVDWTDVHVEEALAVHLQGNARSLVDGTDTALLSVVEEPRLRLVVLGFDLMQSDFPLRVAFPVFINNLLHWCAPRQGEFAGGQIRAGMPYAVFFSTPVEQVTVQDPQGKQREYTVQGNPWIFTEAKHVGVYIIRAGDQKRYLTVSLLDEDESDIAPADALPSSAPMSETISRQQTGVVETPLWPYVLLAAVLAALGEWYVWCRDV
jgi:Ca-activated chloride channel family protein